MRKLFYAMSMLLTMALVWTGCSETKPPVAKKFTVTFNSDGGSNVASQAINEGSKITKPTDPTKGTFIFAGWFKEAACTNEWNFSSDVVTAALTLYAKWTAVEYTVTFETNGGSTIEPLKIAEGTTFKAPTPPTKGNEAFVGWFKEAALTTEWDFSSDVVTAALTLYAKWTTVEYTVTFNTNGGSAIDPVKVAEGGMFKAPTPPTKGNETFVGWFKEEALTTEWDFSSDKITADVTLYAKWTTVEKFAITFNSQGGSDVGVLTIDKGAKITKPTDPTKGTLIFAGWFKEAALTTEWDFSSDVVTAALTLYAKWTTVEYTVTFNTNGGSAIDPVKVAEGGMFKAPLPPSKNNEAFVDWFKEVALTTEWIFHSDVVTADVTLYAKWTTITLETLDDLITTAQKINGDDYTKESYSAMVVESDAARSVSINPEATPAQIVTAHTKLQAAIDALVALPIREVVSVELSGALVDGVIYVSSGKHHYINAYALDAEGYSATNSNVTFDYDKAKLATWAEDASITYGDNNLYFTAKAALKAGETIVITIRSAAKPEIFTTVTLKVAADGEMKSRYIAAVTALPEPDKISYEDWDALYNARDLYRLLSYDEQNGVDVIAAYEKMILCESRLENLPVRYNYSFIGNVCTWTISDFGETGSFKTDFVAKGAFPLGTYTTQYWEDEEADGIYSKTRLEFTNEKEGILWFRTSPNADGSNPTEWKEDDRFIYRNEGTQALGGTFYVTFIPPSEPSEPRVQKKSGATRLFKR